MTAFTTAPCRYCGKPVVWAQNAAGGSIPLDPRAPCYLVKRAPGARTLVAHRTKEDPPGDRAVFVSHFATCPKLHEHTKSKPGGGREESGSVSP